MPHEGTDTAYSLFAGGNGGEPRRGQGPCPGHVEPPFHPPGPGSAGGLAAGANEGRVSQHRVTPDTR